MTPTGAPSLLQPFGLAGDAAWTPPDPELTRLAALATSLLPGLSTAIILFDNSLARRLYTIPGAPLVVDAPPAATTLCGHLLDSEPALAPCLVPDLTLDPRLADHPAVDGRTSALRSYAAVPLHDDSSRPLGTVCAFSDTPNALEEHHLIHLSALAAAVSAALELRRRHLDATALSPLSSRTHRPLAPEEWSIADVLARQEITTLFQPIVHLATAEVVAFEALTRGPKDSPLESPLDLIAAARSEGRLGELDWMCRAQALSQALAADLPACLSWFVNVEPAGLALPCPAPLREQIAAARSTLRVILEVLERDTQGYVTDLIHATDQARLDSWGVALDDVGADVEQLALLPFFQPDVVKLDMSLLRSADSPHTTRVRDAVLGYTERTGAVVLAEGIETVEDLALAQALGATYGQGWLFGRPGPLPDSLPVPRHVIPLRQHPAPAALQTPYDILSATRTPVRSPKHLLTAISRHLEEQAGQMTPSVLLISFDDARFFSGATKKRIEDAPTTLSAVLARNLPLSHTPGWYTGSPIPGSRLAQEWVVAFTSPYHAAAFVARAAGDGEFDYFYTHDRALVISVMRSFFAHVKPAPLPVEPPSPTPPPTLPLQRSSLWRRVLS